MKGRWKIKTQRINGTEMCVQSPQLGHTYLMLVFLMGRGTQCQLVTRFMLNCLKLQKNKLVAPRQHCVFCAGLCPSSQGSPEGRRRRGTGAVAWPLSLWASALASHWPAAPSRLTAVKEWHAATFCVPVTDQRDGGSWTSTSLSTTQQLTSDFP